MMYGGSGYVVLCILLAPDGVEWLDSTPSQGGSPGYTLHVISVNLTVSSVLNFMFGFPCIIS